MSLSSDLNTVELVDDIDNLLFLCDRLTNRLNQVNAYDLNTVELVDDIDNLLFLCDRLTNRLNQVNAYVDEVKQTWINKRRSIEFESNISPILAQKVSKYNKVLLSVAEKLAIVELQTESLHNLQLSVSNLFLGTNGRLIFLKICSSLLLFLLLMIRFIFEFKLSSFKK